MSSSPHAHPPSLTTQPAPDTDLTSSPTLSATAFLSPLVSPSASLLSPQSSQSRAAAKAQAAAAAAGSSKPSYPPYRLQPRLGFVSSDLTPASYCFLNDRTILFPVGRHLFKCDLTSAAGDSTAAAAAAAEAADAAEAAAAEAGEAESRQAGGHNGVQWLCKRNFSSPPVLSVSPDFRRLAVIESGPSGPERGSQHAASPSFSANHSRLQVTVLDLTSEPISVLWQFSHTHVGRFTSVSWSSNAAVLAISVDWEDGQVKRRRNSVTGGSELQPAATSPPDSGFGSRPGSSSQQQQQTARTSHWSNFRASLHVSRPASSTTQSQPPLGSATSLSSSSALPSKTPRYRGAISLWRVDAGKLLSTFETAHSLACIAVHPEDSGLLVAVGLQYLRHIRLVGGRCEEVGLLKRLLERAYVLKECLWLSKELLLVRGEAEVTLLKGGSIRQTLQVSSSASITQMAATASGFLVAADDGSLHSFVFNATPTKLTANQLYLPQLTLPLHHSSLQSMRMNAGGSLLALYVDGVGICSLPLQEEGQHGLTQHVRVGSPVVCIAGNESRGIVVCGHADHGLSVYRDWSASSLLAPPAVHHVFAEMPLALTVHRDGHHVLIAFPSQVGFFHLLLSSVKLSHSVLLPTRIVPPVSLCYSHGHDRVVVMTGVHCFVYDALSFTLLHHVCSLSVLSAARWSDDDAVLVTVNMEGGVMAYDRRMHKVLDEVEKGVEFAALDVDWGVDWADITRRKIEQQQQQQGAAKDDKKTDPSSSAAAGDALQERAVVLASGVHNGVTNRLRFIQQRSQHGMSGARELHLVLPTAEQEEGEAAEQHHLRHAILTHLVIDRQRRLVIASTTLGYLLLLSYPVQTDGEARIHLLHATPLHELHSIAHLVYLPGAGTVITVGADGNTLVTDIRTVDQSAHWAHHGAHDVVAPVLSSATSLPAFHLTPARFLPRVLPAPAGLKSTSLSPFSSRPYTTDPEVIQLRLSEHRHLLSQCRSSEAAIRKIEKTAEYQLQAQKDYYVSHLRLLRGEMEALLAKKSGEVDSWRRMWKKNEGEKESVRDEHEKERERLEQRMRSHAEKRLLEHTLLHEDKCKELEREREERKRKEEEMQAQARQMREEYEHKLQAQHAALTGRVTELSACLSQQEAQYEEALQQLEREYDSELVLIKNQTSSQLSKHRENTAILVAEMSAAKRKLDEKQSSLSNLELVVAEQDDSLHHTSSVIKKLTHSVASSKQQLRLKEEDITRRQYELAGARQDNTVLKNFIEILEHRIAELENREAPALDALMTMKGRIEAMNSELFALNARNQEAREEVKRKKGESERLYASVTSLRHKLAKKEQWVETVRKEVSFLVEHAGNGSANERLHVDVRKLHQQLFTGERGEEGEEGDPEEIRMQNRVAAEIDRQRKYLEKTVVGMRKGMDSLQLRKKREGEKALTQNINFLYEVNRLREENRRLETRLQAYRNAMQRAGLSKTVSSIDGEESQQLATASAMPSSVQSAVTAASPDAAAAAGEEREEEKEASPPLKGKPTLLLGSTRPLWDVSVERRDEGRLLASLDAANEVMERQRAALLQLQRGVETAIELAQRRWYEAEALRKRMREMQGIGSRAAAGGQREQEEEEGKVAVMVEGEDGQISALGGSRSPFKHAKGQKSPSGSVVLPSLAGAGNLGISSGAAATAHNSLEARLAAIANR